MVDEKITRLSVKKKFCYNIAVRHARAEDGKWSEFERSQM